MNKSTPPSTSSASLPSLPRRGDDGVALPEDALVMQRAEQHQQRQQQLSALMDGEATALTGALAAWRTNPQARADWHVYQLAGDVLRSDDLAAGAANNERFLQQLRVRLQAEPALLAPAALKNAALKTAAATAVLPTRKSYRSSMALAASVAALAVAVLVGRGILPGAAGPVDNTVAQTPSDSSVVSADASTVMRDPRLDELMRVHHMARGSMPMGLPGGSLKRADYELTRVSVPGGQNQ